MNTASTAPAWQSGGRIEAGPLAVVFEWQGDRFAHTLLFQGRPVALSVEGRPDEAWPPSPPAQSLMIDQNAQGLPRAMLVGMAGSGHWSASIEAVEGGILFDLACRLRGPVGRLGSTYRLASGWTAEPDGADSSARWTITGPGVALQAELTGCGGEAGEVLAMTVRESSSAEGARTLRWGYLLK